MLVGRAPSRRAHVPTARVGDDRTAPQSSDVWNLEGFW